MWVPNFIYVLLKTYVYPLLRSYVQEILMFNRGLLSSTVLFVIKILEITAFITHDTMKKNNVNNFTRFFYSKLLIL